MKLKFSCLVVLFLLFCACQDEKTDAQKDSVKSVDSPKQNEKIAENPDDSSVKYFFTTKVRSRIGEAFALKGGLGDNWNLVKIGHKMVENDRIRTEIASEVILASVEGSVLRIDESSDVTLKVDAEDENKKIFLVDMKNGKVHFDIQKQKSASFHLKTGIATVAIRGTAGFVGCLKGRTVASLKEGRVDVMNADGKTSSIVQKQTILVDEKGEAMLLNLASSGTDRLARMIDSLSKVEDEKVVDSLETNLKSFDVSYAKHQKAFEKTLKFNTEQLSSKTYVPSVTLSARVTPGVVVTVWGESDTVGANGIYTKTLQWGEDAYGTKRFLASCSDGSVELPCYMWVTEYVSVESSAAVEPDTVAAEPAPKVESENAPAKKMNLSVKLGARTEKIHLDLPATTLNTSLKIDLAGISTNDLDNLKSIEIRRGGKVVKTIGEKDLTSLKFEEPIEIERNKIADFEVVVSAKDGKKYRAKKTYEVYCLVSNHPGGKARNSVVPQGQEYERLKQSGGLSKE